MDTKTPTKNQIITLLDAWIRQRPGLEFGNYGDVTAYRSESRRIQRQLRDARELLLAAELALGMTGEQLAAAFPRAYSGRLTLAPHTKPGTWRLDYCTGQYWPTEYRAAVCAVLASALWDYYREDFAASAKPGESPGDAIRRNFRRKFGATMQKRWFD
jgi:hypothetical protein